MVVCKVQQYTTEQESKQKLVLTKRDQPKKLGRFFLSVVATLIKNAWYVYFTAIKC